MKPPRAGRAGLIFMVLLLGAAAWAGTPDTTERERIRAERAAVQATYLQQLQQCGKEFLVTSCVDAARAQRHAELLRLDRQQQALDEARRAQRASERQQQIDSKLGGEEARRREDAARERSAARRSTEDPKPVAAPVSAAAPRSARAASSSAERAAQEARARRAYELKQLQAEAHRQAVARRNEEHARRTSAGAPLPGPAASAASAAVPKTDGP